MALDYAKWDDLYDSDEERQKEKRAEEAKRKADLRKAKLNPQPQIPGGMTKEQFAAQYAKMFKQPATNQKEPYKFPETMEEQRAKCDEANELKQRGNELYQKERSLREPAGSQLVFYHPGEIVEAAKLYEQSVLKFGDWFAAAWATDEEKEMVFAVKLPAHNNLATCSFRLGNHQHAVVHSTCVLEQQPDNVKALYRRGACQLRLGYLEKARADLQRAVQLAPANAEARAELLACNARLAEYRERRKQLSKRMLAGADGGVVEEAAPSGEETDAPALSAEAEEELTRAALDGLDDEVGEEQQGEEEEEEVEGEGQRRVHGGCAGGEALAVEAARRMAAEESSKRASVEKELRDLQAQIREIKANGLDGTAEKAKPAGDAGGLWRLAAVGASVAVGAVAVTLAAVRLSA